MSGFDSSLVEKGSADHGSSTVSIKVIRGDIEHEVAVPSNLTFGDLKSVIGQKFGLEPESLKLLFRGKEKEDDDDLLTAGVKDNSKVLVMEVATRAKEITEEVPVPMVISRGEDAVAKVREEVDKLSEKVAALQAVLDDGDKVDDKDIVYLTEMLMRQLLKLDTIDAEGEGKIQRRVEVRRVQSFMETMDILKSRNSDPTYSVGNTLSVIAQPEIIEPTCESVTTASQMPSSAL